MEDKHNRATGGLVFLSEKRLVTDRPAGLFEAINRQATEQIGHEADRIAFVDDDAVSDADIHFRA